MKKTIKNIALATLMALSAAVSFTGCHNNIYDIILNEIPLEKKGIKGDVVSIVKANEKLFLSNGNLYTRDPAVQGNEHWSRVSPNFGDSGCNRVVYLASNGTNLYAICSSFDQSSDGINYEANGRDLFMIDVSTNTWTKVARKTDNGTELVPQIVFGDGTKAFVRLSDGLTYELSGSSIANLSVDAETGYCSYAKGTHFKGPSISDGTNVYYADEDSTTLKYNLNGSGEHTISLSTGYILSLAVTKDYLLVGTSNGLYQYALASDGTPATSSTAFTNNAKSIFTSSYEVYPIYVVDSTKNASDTTIFAGLGLKGTISSEKGLFTYKGLYSYYPNRGTWNRDGTSDAASEGN